MKLTTTIQSIDLTGGDGPTAPNYSLLILDLQKLKAPSANGHLIFRQLRNRARLEVTGNSFPKGKYSGSRSQTGSGGVGKDGNFWNP